MGSSVAADTQYDKIIIGIDPGTNVLGYGVIGISGKSVRLIDLGVIKLNSKDSHYLRLGRIYSQVMELVERFLPDEMALEAPFFGKNVQSMLKLGRAQGVAMAAAISRDIPIAEYEPRKVKMAITGNGAASKEQVRELLRRILVIPDNRLEKLELDATDALGVAMCHFYESSRPVKVSGPRTWKDFVERNPDKIRGL